jgi:hypothetical protein
MLTAPGALYLGEGALSSVAVIVLSTAVCAFTVQSALLVINNEVHTAE